MDPGVLRLHSGHEAQLLPAEEKQGQTTSKHPGKSPPHVTVHSFCPDCTAADSVVTL